MSSDQRRRSIRSPHSHRIVALDLWLAGFSPDEIVAAFWGASLRLPNILHVLAFYGVFASATAIVAILFPAFVPLTLALGSLIALVASCVVPMYWFRPYQGLAAAQERLEGFRIALITEIEPSAAFASQSRMTLKVLAPLLVVFAIILPFRSQVIALTMIVLKPLTSIFAGRPGIGIPVSAVILGLLLGVISNLRIYLTRERRIARMRECADDVYRILLEGEARQRPECER